MWPCFAAVNIRVLTVCAKHSSPERSDRAGCSFSLVLYFNQLTCPPDGEGIYHNLLPARDGPGINVIDTGLKHCLDTADIAPLDQHFNVYNNAGSERE